MVAGDAVNTAARVQTAAQPGTVFTDSATQRLAAAGVAFADAGEHVLKGKTEPQQLWRAVRVLAGVGGAQRVDGLEAPLTGRDAELRTIRELFHAAAERKVPRMVVVSGPAGVGKSRLGWEFNKYIDGLAAQMWWHRGRCLSYGDGIAFWALAEIIRQRLSIAEDDPADTAAAKLADGLDRFVPNPAEREYVGARLGRLLGVAPPGNGSDGAALGREELFAGWRLFFERLAATAPVVLLVEDAQHADAGLLDFLDHLTDWVRSLPVFVLVLARPELAEARPGFGTGRNRTTLTLDPLDPASTDHLVDALVPGMPPSARAQITRHAQGLPLFAVETIRSLIDRDIVQPSEGVYRLVCDIGELAVPDSLHALLAARLDSLDPPVRRLVADAAVLGTTFPASALIAISAEDEPAVRTGLADLLRREVLTVSADPLSPERGSYAFAQDMLRQVAYDTLSRRDRKTRHLTVANYLRAAFPGDGEEVTDVIARHYLDALHALPDADDTPHIRGQAITALIRAADRAKRTGAPATAATTYATAAQLTQQAAAQPGAPDQQPDPGALWEKAADAASLSGDCAQAIRHADQARAYYLEQDQPRSAARCQAAAGSDLRRLGRHTEAREQLTAALKVLRPEPDTDTVRVLQDLASLEIFAGSPEADRLTTEALILGQDLGADTTRLAKLFATRGIYLHFAARSTEGIAYFAQAVRLAEQAGDNAIVGGVLLNLAEVLSGTDPGPAAETARTAAGHLRQVGDRPMLSGAIENLAHALLLLGDWDAAADALASATDADGLHGIEFLAGDRAFLAALRGDTSIAAAVLEGLETMRASEDHQDQAMIAVVEALLAAARSQPDKALAHARRVLAHAGALGIRHTVMFWAWPLAARAAHDLHDTTAAGELFAMLDALPPGRIPPILRAERDLARARLAVRAGDPDAGAALAAIASLREHSTPYHLAHGLLDLGERLLGQDEQHRAGQAVAEAEEIAGRLRCQPLLDRAAALMPATTQARV